MKKEKAFLPLPSKTLVLLIPISSLILPFFILNLLFGLLDVRLDLPIRGVKAVTVSGYWQKPLTVTALAVIKFH
jgi:hypothetical protein